MSGFDLSPEDIKRLDEEYGPVALKRFDERLAEANYYSDLRSKPLGWLAYGGVVAEDAIKGAVTEFAGGIEGAMNLVRGDRAPWRLDLAHPEDATDPNLRSEEELAKAQEHSEWQRQVTGEGGFAKTGRAVARTAGEVAGFLLGAGGATAHAATAVSRSLLRGVAPGSISSLARTAERMGISTAEAAKLASNGTLLTEVFARAAAKSPKAKALIQQATTRLAPEMAAQSVGMGTAFAVTEHRGDDRLDRFGAGAIMGVFGAVMNDLGAAVQHSLSKGAKGAKTLDDLEAWLAGKPGLNDRVAAAIGEAVGGTGFSPYDLAVYHDAIRAAVVHGVDSDEFFESLGKVLGSPAFFGARGLVQPSKQRVAERATYGSARQAYEAQIASQVRGPTKMADPRQGPVPDGDLRGISAMESAGWTRTDASERMEFRPPAAAPDAPAATFEGGRLTMPRAVYAHAFPRAAGDQAPDTVVFEGEAAAIGMQLLAMRSNSNAARGRALFTGMEPTEVPGEYWDPVSEAKFVYAEDQVIRTDKEGGKKTFSPEHFLVGRQSGPDKMLAPTFQVARETLTHLISGTVKAEGAVAGGLVTEVAASLRDSLMVLERGDIRDENTVELARLVESPDFAATVAGISDLTELAAFANEFSAVAAGRATAEDALAYAQMAIQQGEAAAVADAQSKEVQGSPEALVDPARSVEPIVEPTLEETAARTKETSAQLDSVVHDLNVLRADTSQDRRQDIRKLEESAEGLTRQLEQEADEVRREKIEGAPRIEDKIPPAEVTAEQEAQQLTRDLQAIVARKDWTTPEGEPNERISREERRDAAAEFIEKAMAAGKEIDPTGLSRIFGLGARRSAELFQEAKVGRQKRIDSGVRMGRELQARRAKAADLAAARQPDEPGRPVTAEVADIVGEVAAQVYERGGGLTRFARGVREAVMAVQTGPVAAQRDALVKALGDAKTSRALWEATRGGKGAFQRVEKVLEGATRPDPAPILPESNTERPVQKPEETGLPEKARSDKLAEALRSHPDLPEKGRAKLADSVTKLVDWANGQAKKMGAAAFIFTGEVPSDLLMVGGAAAAILIGRKVIPKSAALASLRAIRGAVDLGRKAWGVGVRDPSSWLMGRVQRLTDLLEPLATKLTDPLARATWDRLMPKLVGYVGKLANFLAIRDWGVASRLVQRFADSLSPYATALQEVTDKKRSSVEKAKLAYAKMQEALVKAFGSTPEQRLQEGTPKYAFWRATEEGKRPTEAGPVQKAYDLWAEQRGLAAEMLVDDGLLDPEQVIKNYYPHLYGGKVTGADAKRLLAEAVRQDPSKLAKAVDDAMEIDRGALRSMEVEARPIGTALRQMEAGTSRLKSRKRKEANVEEYLLDPLVALPKTLLAEFTLSANKRLLIDIANSAELSVATAEEAAERGIGWAKVDESVASKRMLGELAGRYVHPHTLAEIKHVGNMHRGFFDGVAVAWSLMKQALVVTKPAFAVVQDFTQGMVMAAGGVDPSVWNEKAKVQARKGIESQDAYFKELLEGGEIGTDMAAVELPEVADALRDWMRPGASDSLFYDAMRGIQNWVNKGKLTRPAQFVKKIATESDQLARYVMYRHLRERGETKEAALARVRAVYNYRTLVPLAHALGTIIPFQRFAFKMMEALGKYGLRERPISALFIGMVPFMAARMLMAAMAGETDEDKIRSRLLAGTGVASGLAEVFQIPLGRDAEGNMTYFDATRFMVHEPVLLWLQGRKTPYRNIAPTALDQHPLVQLAEGLIEGENRTGRIYHPAENMADHVGNLALGIAYAAQSILPEMTGVPALAEIIRVHGPGGPEASQKRLGRMVTRQLVPGLVTDEQRVGGIIRSQARGEALTQERAVREPRRRVMTAAMDELRDATPDQYGTIIGGIRKRLADEKLPPLDRGELGSLLSAARSKSAIARGLYGQAFSVQVMTLRRLLEQDQLSKRDRAAALQLIRPRADKIREAAATIASQLGVTPVEASRLILDVVRSLSR